MTLIPRLQAVADAVNLPRPTIFQDNAALAATRSEEYIDQARHAAVREAIALLVEGKPGLAQFKLTRSVERQARVAGVGMAEIPSCPCGGICPDGHES